LAVKRVILISVVVFLVLLSLAVRHYRGNPRELVPESPRGIPIVEILDAHDGRIKDRIDLLKKQTLDESFIELLEDQQYFYPGFQTEVLGVPKDIEKILSTRTFLKVFQQFGALPKEQAVVKVNEFYKRAAKDYEGMMEFIQWQCANPTLDHPNRSKADYVFCTSMLLAARVGERKLLLRQMDEMQCIYDAHIEKMKVTYPGQKFWEEPSRAFGPLEDAAFLTILMYALKQAKMDIPIDESILEKKTIPLYRWDAPLTHYDFAVWHGDGEPNPKDLIEQFDVYAFPSHLNAAVHISSTGEVVYASESNQKKKFVINTLKERLSK